MRKGPILLLLLLAACRTGEVAPPPPPPAPDPAKPSLLGVWTVVGHSMPGISAMSEAEASQWHGLSIRLTPEEAVSRGDRCPTPTYRATPDSLEVSCGGSLWTAFGARMAAAGPDQARALWDGVLFKLVRDQDFTALGQEPGWKLEVVKGKEIRLLYAYGEKQVTMPAVPGVRDSAGTVTYHAVTDSADLRVVIMPVACADVMSGQPYPATVSLTINGEALRGCGQ